MSMNLSHVLCTKEFRAATGSLSISPKTVGISERFLTLSTAVIIRAYTICLRKSSFAFIPLLTSVVTLGLFSKVLK